VTSLTIALWSLLRRSRWESVRLMACRVRAGGINPRVAASLSPTAAAEPADQTSGSRPYGLPRVGLADYFPWYAWVAMVCCGVVAVVPFFVPPSVGTSLGLSLTEYLAVLAAVEFGAAVGIASLVVYYRDTGEGETEADDSEWRFEP